MNDLNDSNGQPASVERRLFLGAAALGLAGGAVAGFQPGEAFAQNQQPASLKGLSPADAAAVAKGYSPGILATGSRVIFVSGQGPADYKADLETQIRQTFDRIGMILKAAGGTFKNVAMIRAYFLHLNRNLALYRKVRLDYLSEPFPASTAIGVPELAIEGLEVEIEAIAIL
jgi:enamine deaminase RidA (YjgF/YER057c/UK114 family)